MNRPPHPIQCEGHDAKMNETQGRMLYHVKEGTDEDGSPLGVNLFAVIAEHMGLEDVLWFDRETAKRVCEELNYAAALQPAAQPSSYEAVASATAGLVEACDAASAVIQQIAFQFRLNPAWQKISRDTVAALSAAKQREER